MSCTLLLGFVAEKLASTGKETIDGVTWRYKIVDGNAVIGRRHPQFCSAISVSTAGDLAIPSSLGGYPVTSIGEWAFYKCAKFSSVTIPHGVTSIDAWAFSGCSGLKSVVLPESVKFIGNDAFNGCSGLASIVVPSNVAVIVENAFAGTPFFDNMPDGLVVLSGIAYKWKGVCPEEVKIPEGVTRIYEKAFERCVGLKSVTIPSSMTDIGRLAFSCCIGLTSLDISEGVTNIVGQAFFCCDNLREVSIPRSLTKIDGYFWANIKKVYVAKGDVERVKALFRESGNKNIVEYAEFVERDMVQNTSATSMPANGIEK